MLNDCHFQASLVKMYSDGISGNNTIEGTLSHGWALDSRDTISTDATPAQNDMKYIKYLHMQLVNDIHCV